MWVDRAIVFKGVETVDFMQHLGLSIVGCEGLEALLCECLG